MPAITVPLGYAGGGVEKVIPVFVLKELTVYTVKNGLAASDHKLQCFNKDLFSESRKGVGGLSGSVVQPRSFRLKVVSESRRREEAGSRGAPHRECVPQEEAISSTDLSELPK